MDETGGSVNRMASDVRRLANYNSTVPPADPLESVRLLRAFDHYSHLESITDGRLLQAVYRELFGLKNLLTIINNLTIPTIESPSVKDNYMMLYPDANAAPSSPLASFVYREELRLDDLTMDANHRHTNTNVSSEILSRNGENQLLCSISSLNNEEDDAERNQSSAPADSIKQLQTENLLRALMFYSGCRVRWIFKSWLMAVRLKRLTAYRSLQMLHNALNRHWFPSAAGRRLMIFKRRFQLSDCLHKWICQHRFRCLNGDMEIDVQHILLHRWLLNCRLAFYYRLNIGKLRSIFQIWKQLAAKPHDLIVMNGKSLRFRHRRLKFDCLLQWRLKYHTQVTCVNFRKLQALKRLKGNLFCRLILPLRERSLRLAAHFKHRSNNLRRFLFCNWQKCLLRRRSDRFHASISLRKSWNSWTAVYRSKALMFFAADRFEQRQSLKIYFMDWRKKSCRTVGISWLAMQFIRWQRVLNSKRNQRVADFSYQKTLKSAAWTQWRFYYQDMLVRFPNVLPVRKSIVCWQRNVLRGRLLDDSFSSWRSLLQRRQVSRALAISQIETGQLKWCWQQWRLRQLENLKSIKLADRLALFIRTGRCLKLLIFWREQAQPVFEAARAAHSLRYQRLLNSAIVDWRNSYARLSVQSQTACCYYNRQILLRNTLSLWVSGLNMARLHANCDSLIRSVKLCKWRARLANLQVASRQADDKCNLKIMRTCVSRWKSALFDRHNREQLISSQKCLIRMGTVFLKWSRMTALYKSAAQAQFAVKSTFRLWMKMSLNIYRLCNEAFIVHDRQLVRQSFQLMRKHHSYTNCNRQIADAAASSHLKYRWFTRWRAHFDKRGKCVSMQKLHMKSRLSSAFKFWHLRFSLQRKFRLLLFHFQIQKASCTVQSLAECYSSARLIKRFAANDRSLICQQRSLLKLQRLTDLGNIFNRWIQRLRRKYYQPAANARRLLLFHKWLRLMQRCRRNEQRAIEFPRRIRLNHRFIGWRWAVMDRLAGRLTDTRSQRLALGRWKALYIRDRPKPFSKITMMLSLIIRRRIERRLLSSALTKWWLHFKVCTRPSKISKLPARASVDLELRSQKFFRWKRLSQVWHRWLISVRWINYEYARRLIFADRWHRTRLQGKVLKQWKQVPSSTKRNNYDISLRDLSFANKSSMSVQSWLPESPTKRKLRLCDLLT